MLGRIVPCLVVCAIALNGAGCSNPADESTPAQVGPAQPLPGPAPAEAAAPAVAEAGASSAAPERVVGGRPILASSSRIDFIGSKVTGKHEGGFKSFTGQVVLDPAGKEVQSITAEIDMNSTWSDNERLTGHLKSPDFFDTARFPTASFVSTEISPGGEKGATHTITGNLTLHGVTKSIRFPATIKVENGAVTLESDFFIKRQEFDIKYPGKPDDLIRDEVVIQLAIHTGA